jgi:hypothetical protein
MKLVGYLASTEEKTNVYRVLVGKPEGKTQLGRPRHTWEDNNEVDLREIRWCCTEWINLFQDGDQWRALANKTLKLRIQ